MRFESRRGQYGKNEKKMHFAIEKTFFSFLLLFFGWSFGFEFQR
jgi:hypothetical protein